MGNEIKLKFNFFIFVLSKILIENKQYTLQDPGRITEISGYITEVQTVLGINFLDKKNDKDYRTKCIMPIPLCVLT